MLVLLIVCLMRLIEMYTNNNKMTRNKCTAKENLFGGSGGVVYRGCNYATHQKCGMPDDDSFGRQQQQQQLKQQQADRERYTMNYFYDVDQSCAEQLRELWSHKAGKPAAVMTN